MSGDAVETRRRADYPHLRDLAVRWGDFDMLQHLNNVQYYRFIECVVTDYLNSIGTDWSNDSIVPLAVESGCRFLRQITLTSTLDAGLRVARIGNSSVQYEIGLFEKNNEAPSAVGRMVHVYAYRDSGKPVAIPDALRAQFSAISTPA